MRRPYLIRHAVCDGLLWGVVIGIALDIIGWSF